MTAVERTAVISADGTYRYKLTRTWDPDTPHLGWIMLNPSTADAHTDDPTIRRCVDYARRWGYGGIVVRNLFALRATDPRQLEHHPDPVGPDNDRHLHGAALDAATIAAWGTRGATRQRDRHVLRLLANLGVTVHRIGPPSAAGHPRHPLYLRADLIPTPHRSTP